MNNLLCCFWYQCSITCRVRICLFATFWCCSFCTI